MIRPNMIDLQNTITDMLYANNVTSKDDISEFKAVLQQNMDIAIEEHIRYLKSEGLYE